jgi:VEFS-Box of polycomb protein
VEHQPKAPKRGRRKFLVPESKYTFYDPVSWVRLEAGTEIPDHKGDHQWLIQRHREAMDEYTDVGHAEKEMCNEWDGFISTKQITSDAYLPRAWLDFVRAKASWIVSSKTRRKEFAKHYSYLVARDVLDNETVVKGFAIIAEAVEARQNGKETEKPSPQSSPKAAQARKSRGGCEICGLPVLGPRMLLCANEVRLQRTKVLLGGFSNAIRRTAPVAYTTLIACAERPLWTWTCPIGRVIAAMRNQAAGMAHPRRRETSCRAVGGGGGVTRRRGNRIVASESKGLRAASFWGRWNSRHRRRRLLLEALLRVIWLPCSFLLWVDSSRIWFS